MNTSETLRFLSKTLVLTVFSSLFYLATTLTVFMWLDDLALFNRLVEALWAVVAIYFLLSLATMATLQKKKKGRRY